jgi:predicted CopG family antitoxin
MNSEKELEEKMKKFFNIKSTKRVIAVRDDTYKKLLELQAQMIQQRKERISLSELIDFLINFYREKMEAKK